MNTVSTVRTVWDAADNIIDRSTTISHQYSLSELKAAEDADSNAYDTALQWLSEGVTPYEWWDSAYDDIKERLLDDFGIEVTTKDITFDLDRAQYVGLGHPYITDIHRFLKRAGLDLRKNPARRMIQDDDLRIESYIVSMGRMTHHIDTYEQDQALNATLTQTLEEAVQTAFDILRDEYDYITSEEYLHEIADANGYLFTDTGELA